MKSRRKWQAIIEDLDQAEAKRIMEIDAKLYLSFQNGELSWQSYNRCIAHTVGLNEADGVEIITEYGDVSGFVRRVLTEIKLVAVIGKVPEINAVDIAKKNKEIFVYTGE
jgi:hypothetical protein